LQCRFLHLVNALKDPSHCGHSAFDSNAHCFDSPTPRPNYEDSWMPLTCEGYCKLVVDGSCPVSGDFAVYETEDQCRAVCDAMTAADLLGVSRQGAYDEDGEPPEDSPNTIGCRDTHAHMAFADPAGHCSHAGPLGAPECAERCESFCVLKQQACPSSQSNENCMADCAKIKGAKLARTSKVRASGRMI